MMGNNIPLVYSGCNIIYDSITHSNTGADLDMFCEDCESKEFTLWDYELKKHPQCKDGIIGKSDEGMIILAD